MPRIKPENCGGKNVTAFLDTIAASEGTSTVIGSDDGYNVLVGGGLFSDYAGHPDVLVALPNLGIRSTAAGRYQILYRYWLSYKQELALPDFSPLSQDLIALQLIKECCALELIQDGQFEQAALRCASRWASLPGAGYGQHENKMDNLLAIYGSHGGMVA